jgi:arylsulfatase A-like enzyme
MNALGSRRHPERPNLLLITVDQLRWDWIGSWHGWDTTPHLDALAETGVRFDRCYTNSPQCAPARVGLAAGRSPWQLGARNNSDVLPRGVQTFYALLRDQGYRTGIVGKLDLNKPDHWNGLKGDRPDCFSWGFTHPVEIEGKMHAVKHEVPVGPYGNCLSDAGLFDKLRADYLARQEAHWVGPVGAADSCLPSELHADRWIADRALGWVADIGTDYPWFLHVSFVGPHDPYDPLPDVADRFRNHPMPSAAPLRDGKASWVYDRTRDEPDDVVAHARRQYTALVSSLDSYVGELLAALEERGERQSTVVAFTSDHGDLMGDHGLWQKTAPYDGALRIPLIVSAAGSMQGGAHDGVVELMDLAPTLCELAEVQPPADWDSRSLVPVLRDPSRGHRDEAVAVWRDFQVLTTNAHKLVRHKGGLAELYDLSTDPQETTNIAADDARTVARLSQGLTARTS